MAYPLVSTGSNAELLAQQEQESENAVAVAKEVQLSEQIKSGSLSSYLHSVWVANRNASTEWRKELLVCLRNVVGEYDAKKKAAIEQMGGSDIWMPLTATKVRAAVAWIDEVLSVKPWKLSATPNADLPPEARQEITQRLTKKVEALYQESQQGGGDPPTQSVVDELMRGFYDEYERAENEDAKIRIERATKLVEDKLSEAGFAEALNELVVDFASYPAAHLRRTARRVKVRKWTGDGYKVTYEVKDVYTRLSPFDAYPGPGCTSPEEGDFVEHMRYRRRSLQDMKGASENWNSEAIDRVLERARSGQLRDWTLDDSEREMLESRTPGVQVMTTNLIDALRVWTSVPGMTLRQWGKSSTDVPDVFAEYEVCAILIGPDVVYCRVVEEEEDRGIWKACWQVVPGSYWGKCPPLLMESIQSVCNAAGRSLVNNMGMASGPMVGVFRDLMPAGADLTKIWPWRIFDLALPKNVAAASNSSLIGTSPITFYQPDDRSQQLLAVYESFEIRADDATNIPRYVHGNEKVGGAGTTFSGLTLLLRNATKGIRSAIANLDRGIIKPVLAYNYYELMGDPETPAEARGDAHIMAAGASGILMQEQAQSARQSFLEMTANPLDAEIIGVEGRADVLHAFAEGALDMTTNPVPTGADIRAKQRATANTPQQPEVDQTRVRVAEIGAQTKAVEIEAEAATTDAEIEAENARHAEEMKVEREKIAASKDATKSKESDS